MTELFKSKYRLLGGKHRDENGKQYVKGDSLMLTPRMAKQLGSRVKPLEEVPDEKVILAPPDEVKLFAKHKGGGRWVVINQATDKPINDGYLTKAEAKELVDGPTQVENPKDLEGKDDISIRRWSESK